MEDLSILTGGRPLLRVAGDTLGGAKPADFGWVRRAWADRTCMGIMGGKGDSRALRAHIKALCEAFDQATDPAVRRKLRGRIGKLLGGTAVLWGGAATELEIETRKKWAERTADALRGAVREGVVPGGGVALLACRPALEQRLRESANADERAAYRILIKAMEAPICAILTNAGYKPGRVMAQIRLARNGHGFDVRSREVVDMAVAGIWDATTVVKTAVRSAIAGAALALTTDVVVHHKEPKKSLEP
ncbi:MAG: TCP-1/cpn60 chaperonin family protein [Anaerolineae bacterium]